MRAGHIGIVASALLLLSLRPADQPQSALIFKSYGFSISALDTKPAETMQQVLFMTMPASDGFAPNVNVQIQPHAGTLDEYVELSKQQFKDAEFTLDSERKIGKSAVVFSYFGKLGAKKFRWHAKAELHDGKVYLATATATEAQWEKVMAPLVECVESLRTKASEEGSGPGDAKP